MFCGTDNVSRNIPYNMLNAANIPYNIVNLTKHCMNLNNVMS